MTVDRAKGRARGRSGPSKRLAQLRRHAQAMTVEGNGLTGAAAQEALAVNLHESGDYGEIAKFRAFQAYRAARQAGQPHDLACEAAAAHIGSTAYYANDLVQESRRDDAAAIVLTYDMRRRKGDTVDEALLHTMREWGFGDGRADRQGRVSGRGLKDLKDLLNSHGRDLSGSKLRPKRTRRASSSPR
jgi:hypothetical protein